MQPTPPLTTTSDSPAPEGVDPTYNGFVHEYDDNARHRIRIVGASRTPQDGEWASYNSLAELVVKHGMVGGSTLWLCATEYWAGTIAPDRVFKVKFDEPTLVATLPEKDIRYAVEALND